MQERWLSVDEIAPHPGVNPDTTCKRITRKKMSGHKLARLWKLLGSEMDVLVPRGARRRGCRCESSGSARSEIARPLTCPSWHTPLQTSCLPK